MQEDVISYINSCPICLKRKAHHDIAPVVDIETTQPLELFNLDYSQIEPSKGNTEMS